MGWRHWVFQSTWGSYQNTDIFCWQLLVSCWFKGWYNHFSPVMELLLFPPNDELGEVEIILQQPTVTSYCVQWFVYQLYYNNSRLLRQLSHPRRLQTWPQSNKPLVYRTRTQSADTLTSSLQILLSLLLKSPPDCSCWLFSVIIGNIVRRFNIIYLQTFCKTKSVLLYTCADITFFTKHLEQLLTAYKELKYWYT